MANRKLPAFALGQPKQVDHSKRPQQSVTTAHDTKGFVPRVRQEGLNKEANKAVTGVAATDIFTVAAHGYQIGDRLRFAAGPTGGAGLVVGQDYFVIAANFTTNTFSLSLTKGGASIDMTTDLTAGTIARWIPAMIGAHSVSGRDTPDIAGPRQ